MLYYGDAQREIDPRAVLRDVEGVLSEAGDVRGEDGYRWALRHHAALVGAAVALGEIHQAVADSLCPEVDDVFPQTDHLAEGGILVGRCVFRSWEVLRRSHQTCGVSETPQVSALPHPTTPHLLEAAREAVLRLEELRLAPRMWVRVPEGYAFYSLYPESYFCSLLRLLETKRSFTRYAVIGIRSIGTSLATLVAGALQELGFAGTVETVRPRGHPFERFINVAPTLRHRLADACASSAFLVVDEGPGLTCSSFLSVAALLENLGAPAERITALSAWRGMPSIYASDELRARWARLRVYYTDAADAFEGWGAMLPFVADALGRGAVPPPSVEELSYGRWRERFYPSEDRWPVVHRPAERTKLLFSFEDAPHEVTGVPSHGPGQHYRILAKFAGLGEYGIEKLARAQVLAEAGFSPPVGGLAYGFLLQQFVDGRPLQPSELSESIVARMVRYYAFVARKFGLPPAPRFEQLSEMIHLNALEAAGLDASAFVERWRPSASEIDGLPLARLDGRPFPHEWLEVPGPAGPLYLKTDSADHFRDHTAVGEQSILWDLAGACEEWEMGDAWVEQLIYLWEEAIGDTYVRRLMDFYRAGYLAFRTAALHYAIHSTNEEEIRRSLQHQQWKINLRLDQLLKANS